MKGESVRLKHPSRFLLDVRRYARLIFTHEVSSDYERHSSSFSGVSAYAL